MESPHQFYHKQNKIGTGSFGSVYKGIDLRTSKPIAIKIIDVEAAEDELEDIHQEIRIIQQLHSPYITEYYTSFMKDDQLWIVMEYCMGGSCLDLLRPGPIRPDYISIIVRELLNGLVYLHRERTIHRDVKAANVLLDAQGNVKLADFGVSGQISQTLGNRATFVIRNNGGYTEKADIWSLGITVIELFTGEPPHSGLPVMQALKAIVEDKLPLDQLERAPELCHFVRRCLNKNPRLRPSATDLLRDPFIAKYAKKSTSCLTELIARHAEWRETGSYADSDSEDDDSRSHRRREDTYNDPDEPFWNTVKGYQGKGVKPPPSVMRATAVSSTSHSSGQSTDCHYSHYDDDEPGKRTWVPNKDGSGRYKSDHVYQNCPSDDQDDPELDEGGGEAILEDIIVPSLVELSQKYGSTARIFEVYSSLQKLEQESPGALEGFLLMVIERLRSDSALS
ncbi:uncharacterized protein BJ171DRAFT_576664 [Polychytrium aggregatum]|uniref:uncharacterized protein n=1 Tax=Polychytrium aggregatum TaxID=110093 RepID=UPI0022FF4564|nr:uncharacterized protein BJ171DRAFT_576664 [Polychytrium aggregatum]KAI9209858.1 hypothetical protein BJ171DRAFT_576664 [Polychytrium aggregatum]